jgi:hypothetical protein
MKVVCVDNKYYESLIIGKTYNSAEMDSVTYFITDDCNSGWFACYEKELFKTLSEIRNEKINKLLEE